MKKNSGTLDEKNGHQAHKNILQDRLAGTLTGSNGRIELSQRKNWVNTMKQLSWPNGTTELIQWNNWVDLTNFKSLALEEWKRLQMDVQIYKDDTALMIQMLAQNSGDMT